MRDKAARETDSRSVSERKSHLWGSERRRKPSGERPFETQYYCTDCKTLEFERGECLEGGYRASTVTH